MREVTPVDMSGKTARFRRDVIITIMDETGIPRLQPWECQLPYPAVIIIDWCGEKLSAAEAARQLFSIRKDKLHAEIYSD